MLRVSKMSLGRTRPLLFSCAAVNLNRRRICSEPGGDIQRVNAGKIVIVRPNMTLGSGKCIYMNCSSVKHAAAAAAGGVATGRGRW